MTPTQRFPMFTKDAFHPFPHRLGSDASRARGQAVLRLWPILCVCLTLAAQPARVKEPVDSVNPNIGTIGHLLTATVPYVQVPHGMARLAPVTTPGTQDRYLADRIYGFPAGPATLMAYTGEMTTDPARIASRYDHDFETATPYWYRVRLDDSDIEAEFTATQSAAYYRFTMPSAPHAHLSLSVRNGEIILSEPGTVSGFASAGRNDGGVRSYFYAGFSKPIAGHVERFGSALSFASDFATRAGEQIEVRVGISYISVEQAKKNLEREIAKATFDQVKARTRAAWNQALSTILVKGGTDRQRTIFYTALYRTLSRMTDITEDGKYYSGYDHQVHQADGHDFYVDDGLWDTYRCAHPLAAVDRDAAADGHGAVLHPDVRAERLDALLPVAGRRPRGDDRPSCHGA